MQERVHVVYNAADAINHFTQANISFPSAGEAVDPSEILQVIESRYRRLYCLLGFTALGDEVVLSVLSINDDKITIEDRLGNLSEEWVARIAQDPEPRVTVPHGDLIFDLERFSDGEL